MRGGGGGVWMTDLEKSLSCILLLAALVRVPPPLKEYNVVQTTRNRIDSGELRSEVEHKPSQLVGTGKVTIWIAKTDVKQIRYW